MKNKTLIFYTYNNTINWIVYTSIVILVLIINWFTITNENLLGHKYLWQPYNDEQTQNIVYFNFVLLYLLMLLYMDIFWKDRLYKIYKQLKLLENALF